MYTKILPNPAALMHHAPSTNSTISSVHHYLHMRLPNRILFSTHCFCRVGAFCRACVFTVCLGLNSPPRFIYLAGAQLSLPGSIYGLVFTLKQLLYANTPTFLLDLLLLIPPPSLHPLYHSLILFIYPTISRSLLCCSN